MRNGVLSPSSGASSCISCSAGTYQPSTGSTNCIDCSPAPIP
ncbi:MAG: hypothetical protein IPN76_06815 [Saprospiraceae bacterium]|nr:hypothetical protein [Saprospiraceae bacterium]